VTIRAPNRRSHALPVLPRALHHLANACEIPAEELIAATLLDTGLRVSELPEPGDQHRDRLAPDLLGGRDGPAECQGERIALDDLILISPVRYDHFDCHGNYQSWVDRWTGEKLL
jgi:hypothetical protein